MSENNFKEAPASINWRMTDPFGVDIQITLRSESNAPEDVFEALADREKLMEELLKNNYKVPVGFTNSHKAAAAPAAAAPVDPNTPSCACGVPRVLKTGSSAKGPWSGWMCANRKCDPQWNNRK